MLNVELLKEKLGKSMAIEKRDVLGVVVMMGVSLLMFSMAPVFAADMQGDSRFDEDVSCENLQATYHPKLLELIQQCAEANSEACEEVNSVSFHTPVAWKKCERDSDCVAAMSWCGEDEAVHQAYEVRLEATVQCLDGMFVECGHLKESAPRVGTKAFCNEQKRCDLEGNQ